VPTRESGRKKIDQCNDSNSAQCKQKVAVWEGYPASMVTPWETLHQARHGQSQGFPAAASRFVHVLGFGVKKKSTNPSCLNGSAGVC